MSTSRVERVVFGCLILTLIVSLVPFWVGQYFLTSDGPCHLYNSSVLLDYFQSDHINFYNKYYLLNPHTDPNWMSHLLLAGLLSVLPGFLAEKIFLTAYLIGFAFSLHWLLRSIHRQSGFLALLGIPFALGYHFQLGFYNYSLSFVFFFLALGYLIRVYERMTARHMLALAVMLVVLYFTHPVALFLMCASSGLLVVASIKRLNQHGGFRSWLMMVFKVFLAFAPSLLLLLEYLSRKGLNPSSNNYLLRDLAREIIENRGLITMTEMETVWALWVGLSIMGLLLFGIVRKLRDRRLLWSDGFFILWLISLVIYFFQPGGMAGAGIMKERLQLLPFLLALPWLAGFQYPVKLKLGVTVFASFLGIMLIVARLPHHIEASDAVAEYLTLQDHIEDESVVLPLSFSHNGKTPEGKYISERIWLFMHAADYLGVNRHMVMLGNYEANSGHFPLFWRSEINPFHFLGGISGGIEGQPPDVDIEGYRVQTGINIDYVILLSYDESQSTYPQSQILFEELDRSYSLENVSKFGRARLYKRN